MATWEFCCIDNSGFRQCFKVKASNKTDAIRKGMERAHKHEKGNIYKWECKLVRALL